ncbi:MAG: DUF3105 domain-containing protein [Actinomycetes bacterium]
MGSNAQRRREAREKKVAQLRKEDKSRQRRSSTLVTIVLVVAVVLAIAGVWWAVAAGSGGGDSTSAGDIEGVKTYDNLSRNHTTDPVSYPQTPPVGGDHNPQWLDCTGRIYDKPVHNENAVHGLEHGAVWVTYDPSLPQADIDALKSHIDGSYIFMSPYPDQGAPIALTAWGKQLKLQSATDPRIDQFITEYRQGAQTPEPGAPCDPASPMPSPSG